MSFFRPAGMLRSVVRPMMTKQTFSRFRPVAFVQPSSTRLFASQSPVSAVTQQLTEALTSEIEAEKKLEKEQLGGAAAPTMPGFKLENDEAIVKLTKSYNNEKITVFFNVNHSVDMDGMDEFEHEHEGGQPQHDDQGSVTPVSRPLFTVEVEKDNERLCFELELVDAHDEHGQFDYRVEEFYIAPAGNSEIDPKIYSSSGKYIDENLYNLLFLKFLEERGINAEFCENLVRFATHYEHAQYVLLLQKIKSFVSK